MSSIAKITHHVFNHKRLRKVMVSYRLPLFVAGFTIVLHFAQPAWFLPALVVALVGEFIQLWCFASLNKQNTLAYNGLYGHVRNPMYLGRFLLVMGYVLLLGNWYVVLPVAVIYCLYMWHRVQREEGKLKGIFAHSYEDYCTQVNRFVPSVRGMPGGNLWFWSWRLFTQNHGWGNLGTVVLSFTILYVWFTIHK